MQKFREKTNIDSKISPSEALNLAKKHISFNKLHELDEILIEGLSDFFTVNSKILEELKTCSRKNKEFTDKCFDSLKSSEKYSELFNEYESKLSL